MEMNLSETATDLWSILTDKSFSHSVSSLNLSDSMAPLCSGHLQTLLWHAEMSEVNFGPHVLTFESQLVSGILEIWNVLRTTIYLAQCFNSKSINAMAL